MWDFNKSHDRYSPIYSVVSFFRKCTEYSRYDDSRQSTLSASALPPTAVGLPPVAATTDASHLPDYARPPPVENCKKPKGKCNHIIIFGKHYNRIVWEDHAKQIRDKQPIYQLPENLI